ncbi:centromere-associated protein E [Pseudoliparis swirei]|uniref:centromere-associated protein E n=1 Tax=Pseudoliparis swirei TaxID=2059687 RepID=UPI0024BED12D|nr:centromere-associated protein E [Pseudoliparis swirei]
MAEESAVKVCVRVRPLIEREENAALENAEPVQLFWKADKKSIHQIDDGNSTKSFVFDRVFIAEETTNQLYQDIAKPLIVSSVEGYNGTIFAYGQTSSGKTFTMMGCDRTPGVIPLAVEDVFQTIKNCSKKEFLLRVSYMEIYNETVTDLLVDSWKRKPLEVRETINKTIFVSDLTEELVTSTTQALAWIRKGEKNRHYGKTKMNERSSRSHAIFRMILESRERCENAEGENADGAIIVSHLNLVDLAGSERASQAGADGARCKEGCNINRSLFTLSQVIKKLTDESQKGFTNYRDSKLTRILQNSLGGNAKTVIICTITPVALDETLSTLQFASTAKKMKNDPHVTEVSDDGALLSRYRNEIVDLKRRLTEVSSVTQTTATEKKVLSELLQEKDQLQREQQDRIRNLTKLLVTSSNQVTVRKLPKRRVTWGGKMIRLARPSVCGGPADLSFADSFTRKRKAERSCLSELCEDDEDFESQWEISDEPSDEMDMSQSSVTVRSFGNSPKDSVSPDYIHKLSGKVSHLELQLDIESLHKEEAMTRAETSDGRVAELELQLQAEAKESNEKAEMLDIRVADLEMRLEEQSHTPSETKQMSEQFGETIQLCETLATEKESLAAERDYLKQELGMFIEETERLEKENAALSKEVEEKREVDEFRSLEDDFRKGHEDDTRNEISELKRAAESSERQRLELQNKLETLSEELQKKTEFVKELESMSGKDLVQEVAMLRRSLADAEGLSRDTKKEWAHLRSENIALDEMNVTLSANSEKMEAEATGLRGKLEAEKSRGRAMQSDLQKELSAAFDENTKLTALLDGKVPKNLIDSVELERAMARLNRELSAAREAEGALRAQLEELASAQTLPDEVEHLTAQLSERTEELRRVRAESDAALSEQRSAAEETETLLAAERDQLTGELQGSLERAAQTQLLLQSLRGELQEQSRNNSDLDKLAEQKESEYGEHVLALTQELRCARDEEADLLSAQRSSAEETEKLLSSVASLAAERDQLQTDMQDNVDMMIENQQELRTALDKTQEQKERIKHLEAARASKREDAQLEELQTLTRGLTEELESVRAQRDELSSERTAAALTHREETERLQSGVTSLSQERDELQDALEALRQEKRQLRAQLEEHAETVALAQSGFNQPETLTSEPQPHEEEVTRLQQEVNDLQVTLQAVAEQKSQLEVDLQRTTETDLETRCLLQAELQEQKQLHSDHMTLCEQKESDLDQQTKTLSEQLENALAERDALLAKESVGRSAAEETERLQSVVTSLSQERDELQDALEALRQEKRQLRAQLEEHAETVALAQSGFNQPETLTSEPQPHEEEVTRLQQEVNDLQATLQAVAEQKSQLEVDLQRTTETVVETQRLLQSLQAALQEQEQLHSDRTALREQQESDSDQQAKALAEQLEAERDALLAKESVVETLEGRVASLGRERDELRRALTEEEQLGAEVKEHKEEVYATVRQLTAALVEAKEQRILTETLVSSTERLLKSVQEELCEQKQANADLDQLRQQKERQSEKLQLVEEERDALLSEREAGGRSAAEETERLRSGVTSLSQQRDELQDALEALRQEKRQLRAQLEEHAETTTSQSEKLQLVEEERDALLAKESVGRSAAEETERLRSGVTSLSQQRDELQDALEALRQEKRQLRAQLEEHAETVQQLEEQRGGAADASQQLLSEANATISALREQLSGLDRSAAVAKETASSRLQESTGQIQKSLRKFQSFIDRCAEQRSAAPGPLEDDLSHLPHATAGALSAVCELDRQVSLALGRLVEHLQAQAQQYRDLFQQLADKDLAVFEETRRQDLLLCREDDVTELLDKRQRLLQKMSVALEKLRPDMFFYADTLSAELSFRERLTEQLTAVFNWHSGGELHGVLIGSELDHLAELVRSTEVALQAVVAEHRAPCEELRRLEADADARLREERSKTSAALEGGAAQRTERQQLELQRAEETIKALHEHVEQLEEARLKASSRVSNQKQATQLLQTELQDSRAQVEEKDHALQSLRSKLRQSENSSPGAVQLESLRAKLFKVELALSSATERHRQEIQKMNSLLKEKEEGVRKLKETLRKCQQEGDDSILQGEDLHARLTAPRGVVIKTSVQLEKSKLADEVKRLQVKISDLESSVSNKEEDVSKWKSRAIALRMKSKVALEKPSSPCTPTKRGHASSSYGTPTKRGHASSYGSPTPRKAPDSPQSRFSEMLSRTCPRQFFDNSALGTVPEAAAEEKKEENWWPMSPKQEEMCKTQ